jgi:hypothetical protein
MLGEKKVPVGKAGHDLVLVDQHLLDDTMDIPE